MPRLLLSTPAPSLSRKARMSLQPPTSPKGVSNPLKRLLSSKTSKSGTSLAKDAAGRESVAEDQVTSDDDRPGSIARTLQEEEPPVVAGSVPAGQDAQPNVAGPAPAITALKEKKRKMSVVDKFKWFGNERKDKNQQESNAPERLSMEPSNPRPESETISSAALAKRIRELLTSVPPFYPTVAFTSTAPASGSQPPTANPSEDPLGTKLLALLSDPNVMSGSDSSGRESVWSCLDRMSFNFGGNLMSKNAAATTHPDNSIMFYAPLVPESGSKVELAQYSLFDVPLDEFDKHLTEGMNAAGWWPWKRRDKPQPVPDKTKEVRVWIPSKEKISFQVAWWGFRIWLPPPMMRILDDKTLEAAKRAAMLTTALSWLLNNIPTAALPAELQLVVTVLKAIVPILGYLGGFIAWSWSTIKDFDKGEGVVLSATWLLPIALIPGAWDFVEPPPPPEPAPVEPVPAPPAPTPAPDPVPGPDPVPQPPTETIPVETPAPPAGQPGPPA